MKKIEILVAVDNNYLDDLKHMLRRNRTDYVDGDLTEDETYELREHFFGYWNEITIGGFPIPASIVSFYMTDHFAEGDEQKDVLIEKMISMLGTFRAIAFTAFNSDGSMYGMTLVPPVYDEDGNEIEPEKLIGTPVYPLPANYMDVFPGIPVYDEDGNIIGYERPTSPLDLQRLSGSSERIWEEASAA